MNVRSFATPLTIAAFLSVGITGLCMLLDYKGGFVENLHELSGILMLTASVLHLWVNKAMLLKHVQSKVGAALAILSLVVLIIALLPLGGKSSEGKGTASRRLMEVATRADLKGVAILAHKSPSVAVTELRAKGLVVESENLTIEELARRNKRSTSEVLSLVLPAATEGDDEHEEHEDDD